MTIQEQAQALIEATDQVEALREWSEVEDMAFVAFASEYTAGPPTEECKGCHG